MITKLTIKGTVHNEPERAIEHTYSVPLGMSFIEVSELVRDFSRAFDFKEAIVSGKPR